ncbi:hypothetical protein [Streptomyces sp. NPDC059701]|uniref:hypothetical protein n=1 Tax=Streptomyces sp. NPDC059701 TaxID=3346914 RepID=UPI0036AC317A
MGLFKAKVTVTDQSGNTREINGTVSHPSPMYDKSRARVDARNAARKQLKPGEQITGDEIRYSS